MLRRRQSVWWADPSRLGAGEQFSSWRLKIDVEKLLLKLQLTIIKVHCVHQLHCRNFRSSLHECRLSKAEEPADNSAASEKEHGGKLSENILNANLPHAQNTPSNRLFQAGDWFQPMNISESHSCQSLLMCLVFPLDLPSFQAPQPCSAVTAGSYQVLAVSCKANVPHPSLSLTGELLHQSEVHSPPHLDNMISCRGYQELRIRAELAAEAISLVSQYSVLRMQLRGFLGASTRQGPHITITLR